VSIIRTVRSLTQRPFLVLALIAAFLTVWLFSMSGPVAMDDGLRHVEMGRRMAEKGTVLLDWSEFISAGVLKDLRTDPWFLADASYIPLASLPALTALRVFTILSFLGLGASFLLLLRAYDVSARAQTWLLLLLTFGEANFFFRMMIGRPFVLVTAAAILTFWMLRTRRWWLLCPLLLLSTLFSHLFIFPLGLAVCGAVWLFLARRERRGAVHVAVASVIGVGLGFLLHPGPAEYLWYLQHVLAVIPFLGSLGLGVELTTSIYTDMISVMLTWAAIVLAVGFLTKEERGGLWRTRHDVVFFVLLIVLFTGAYLFWTRAIDFLWPLMLVTLGLLVARYPDLPARFRRHLLPQGVLGPVGLGCLLLLMFGPSVRSLAMTPFRIPSLDSIGTALEKVPQGSTILLVDWELMPALVHQRHDLRFTSGMDPTFTYLADPDMTLKLRELESFPELPINLPLWLRTLPEDYVSPYVVVASYRHPTLVKTLRTLPGIESIGSSIYLDVFKLSPSLLPSP